MKLKYAGESFGVDGLTNGRIYIATIGDSDYYCVFDDSGEDYLYPRINPRPCDGSSLGGEWEIFEDMTERENALNDAFKGAEGVRYNELVDESCAIAAEYAEKYKDEIEENVEYNLRGFE